MLNITSIGTNSFHISEGAPEKSMLYRYNILKKDVPVPENKACALTEDTITLQAKRLVSITVEKAPQGYRLTVPMSEKERFFGMGDATRTTVSMRGQQLIHDIVNVERYGPMPVFLSTDGWSLLLNCTYRSVFDFGASQKDLVIDVSGGDVDFYLFSGDSLKELLSRVTDITGKPMILPKFAYGLTLVHNEETDARSLLTDTRLMRDRDIPCDVMGLEPTWMAKFYDFSIKKKWNPTKYPFPSWLPENTSDYYTFFYPLRKMGMQLSLWLCQNYDLLYAEDQQQVQVGNNEFTDNAVIKDSHFTSDVRADKLTKIDEPWFEHLKKFVDNGAAAFKLDGSNQTLRHPDRLWGGKYLDAEVHNVYPVLYAKQMTNGFREYTDRRLLLYTANAYIGSQQYAATWAGDTGGGPNTVASLLNYAMCGHSNTSCDIDVNPAGLHYGFLLPWSQYFCWANWNYPWYMGEELENMIRWYSKLRSSLFPYLYSMAHKAYKTALPMMRPLPLMFEDTDRFDDVKNAYMLGDSLYVGVFDMNLKLPQGKWVDYFTGDIYEGDITYTIPEGKGGALFVRAGSVLVTMKPQKYILEKEHDYIIQVYPGGNGSFTLVEDDGFTYDYEKGLCAQTLIETTETDSSLDLLIHPRQGDYTGRPDNGHDILINSIPEIKGILPERDMQVELHGAKPASIVCDGMSIPFEYDGQKATFTAKLAGRGNKALRYTVTY